MPEEQALNPFKLLWRVHRVSTNGNSDNVNLRFSGNINMDLSVVLTWRWCLIGGGSRELLRASTLNLVPTYSVAVSEAV
jgi:hypothetical protein